MENEERKTKDNIEKKREGEKMGDNKIYEREDEGKGEEREEDKDRR